MIDDTSYLSVKMIGRISVNEGQKGYNDKKKFASTFPLQSGV